MDKRYGIILYSWYPPKMSPAKKFQKLHDVQKSVFSPNVFQNLSTRLLLIINKGNQRYIRNYY